MTLWSETTAQGSQLALALKVTGAFCRSATFQKSCTNPTPRLTSRTVQIYVSRHPRAGNEKNDLELYRPFSQVSQGPLCMNLKRWVTKWGDTVGASPGTRPWACPNPQPLCRSSRSKPRDRNSLPRRSFSFHSMCRVHPPNDPAGNP